MSVIVGIKYQVGRTEGRTKVCRVIFNEHTLSPCNKQFQTAYSLSIFYTIMPWLLQVANFNVLTWIDQSS